MIKDNNDKTKLNEIQELELRNRAENFDFEQASKEMLTLRLSTETTKQKVDDAQRAYEQFNAKNTPLAQLSQFSTTLADTLSTVKQAKDQQDADDQYFKTMQGLTNGDIALATLQEKELTQANTAIDGVASSAQVQGAPLQTVEALKGLKGGRRIGAAKALADAVLRRYPASLP